MRFIVRYEHDDVFTFTGHSKSRGLIRAAPSIMRNISYTSAWWVRQTVFRQEPRSKCQMTPNMLIRQLMVDESIGMRQRRNR